MSFDNEASNRDNDAALDAADARAEEHEVRRGLADALRGLVFDEGVQLGARVEHRVAVEALVTALLKVLGKDRADGLIDLGCVGQWYVSPYDVGAQQTKHGTSF